MASCDSKGKAENGRVVEVSGSTIKEHVRKPHTRYVLPKTPSFEAQIQTLLNENSGNGGDGSLKELLGDCLPR